MTWKPRLIHGGRSPAVHPSATTEALPALELVPPLETQTPATLIEVGVTRSPTFADAADVADQEPSTPPHRGRDEAEVPIIATILGLGMFP